MSVDTLYKNTLIEHGDNDARTWYSDEYPQSIIDNYLPGDTNIFYDTHMTVSFENIEYHYFMLGWVIVTELVIRKYPNHF